MKKAYRQEKVSEVLHSSTIEKTIHVSNNGRGLFKGCS